jgi:hypothetical protein
MQLKSARRAETVSCAAVKAPYIAAVRNFVVRLTPLKILVRPGVRLVEAGVTHQPSNFHLSTTTRSKVGDWTDPD